MLSRPRGNSAVNIGADTETCEGPPFTFQFYSPELGIEEIIFLRHGEPPSAAFFRFLDSIPFNEAFEVVIWVHNLDFDMVSFFYDVKEKLRVDPCEIERDGWTGRIIFAHVVFANFSKGNKRVRVVDTFAYFKSSLARLGDIVCPDLPKLKAPEGLGKKIFTAKDKNFCEYAMRDAVIAYRAGAEITKMHLELDVTQSVSAPHFASKVFRRKFLRAPIPLPPRKLVYSAMRSYHGGKNNMAVPKGIYHRVYALDIRSAYPFAMAALPSFSKPELFYSVTGEGQPDKPLPPCGIYKVSGKAAFCRWPSIFDAGFYPVFGDFSGIWITGYELNEALRANEIRVRELEGYYYDAEKDAEPSPFKAYVDYFFHKKEYPEDKIHREFYKLLLNSLYGKFMQTGGAGSLLSLHVDMEHGDVYESQVLTAGGLFNPFIATLITGHTRAFIHRLEHEYQALHTSTDGVFTQIKPEVSQGLGGLSIEAYGTLLLLRNKLYIFYGKTERPDAEKIKSALYPSREITKYAKHGFRGTVQALEKLYMDGATEYEYVKVNKLRESLRRGLTANKFETRRASLK